MKIKFFYLVLMSLSLSISSCSNDDDNPKPETQTQKNNIVKIAQETPDLSSLVAALSRADGNLVNVLSGTGPFTVLAPTNAAFAAFLSENGFSSLEQVPTDLLSQVLLNHVIIGTAVNSSYLIDAGSGYTKTAASGANGNVMSLYFNTTTGVTFNGISSVTQADILASNGIIHIVDTVIGIPTVVTFAAADPNFSTLVSALTNLTPDTDFVSILSRTEVSSTDGINPNFTVFAPTNAAFSALTSIPAEPVLTQVLLHHVISEANIISGDLNSPGNTTAATLQGDNITITLPGIGDNIANVTDGSGNTNIGIIVVDIQAGNGVIHVINKVMIPSL